LGELSIKEPANKIIFFIVVILAVIYILVGNTVLPIR
jgi:hypothetical protein